jgi:hypothetical protein
MGQGRALKQTGCQHPDWLCRASRDVASDRRGRPGDTIGAGGVLRRSPTRGSQAHSLKRARKQAAGRPSGALRCRLVRRQQNAREGGPVPPSNVKENLSPYLGSSVIFERVPARPNAGRPIQHTRWVELVPVLHSTRTVVSASRLEPTDDRSTRCSCQKRDLGDPSLALSDGATV